MNMLCFVPPATAPQPQAPMALGRASALKQSAEAVRKPQRGPPGDVQNSMQNGVQNGHAHASPPRPPTQAMSQMSVGTKAPQESRQGSHGQQ